MESKEKRKHLYTNPTIDQTEMIMTYTCDIHDNLYEEHKSLNTSLVNSLNPSLNNSQEILMFTQNYHYIKHRRDTV